MVNEQFTWLTPLSQQERCRVPAHRRNEEDVSVSVGMGSLRVVTVQRHRHEPTLASKARSTRRALQKPGWRQCASRARRSGVRRPRASRVSEFENRRHKQHSITSCLYLRFSDSLVAGQGRRRRTHTDSFVSSLLRFFVVTVGTFQLDGDRPPTSLFLNSTFCQVLPASPVRNTPRSECAW